jgi:hypothetical protein
MKPMEQNIQEKSVIPQKRDTRLEIRLTEGEYDRLKTVSEDYGSVSDYVRQCCLEMGDRVGDSVIATNPQRSKVLKETLVELRLMNMQIQKVGVNLNQTSKHIHFLERHSLGDANVIGRLNQNYIQVQSTLWEADKSLRELIHKLTKR